jgi:multiple sugar transport system permease protein
MGSGLTGRRPAAAVQGPPAAASASAPPALAAPRRRRRGRDGTRPPAGPRRWSRRPRRRGRERSDAVAGWAFMAPALIVFLVFFVAPIVMGVWVSLTDWNGQTNPLASGGADFVGADNYRNLLTRPGLLREDFAISLRNTLYYVLVFVPGVTGLSLGLAMIVNHRLLRGRGFFRTAFYFPSVTSSVAVSILFIFLFASTGVVNALLATVGIEGPSWFNDARGVVHIALDGVGVDRAPGWAADTTVLGLPLWDWLSGPSVALVAFLALVTWSTSGTFMLFFLAGLQNIPLEVDEAAAIDGATPWTRFRHITLPLMRRSIVLVVTLALIGSWQVFDAVFIISQGAPGETTLTPAYMSYQRSFTEGRFGQGAAIAFSLFTIIVVLTALQRWITRERNAA